MATKQSAQGAATPPVNNSQNQLAAHGVPSAHDSAAEIVAAAEKEAKATRDRALADAEQIRGDVARAVRAADHAINRW